MAPTGCRQKQKLSRERFFFSQAEEAKAGQAAGDGISSWPCVTVVKESLELELEQKLPLSPSLSP